MIAALCGAGCPEASRPPQVPVAKAEEEIAKGIISVTSVLGELRAPFFRVICPSYSKLAFAKDTQWDEMLTAYHDLLT
jgi:hypothetical protein